MKKKSFLTSGPGFRVSDQVKLNTDGELPRLARLLTFRM